jgi:Fe-Mn family superoxide dismutase
MPVLDRRKLLAFGSAALVASALPRVAPAATGPFVQPALPFGDADLAPVISSQTVQLHYSKHHAGYYTALNALVQGTPYLGMALEEVITTSAVDANGQKIFNQAAQAWNHVQYWDTLIPGGARQPRGVLAAAIQRDFGSFEAFKTGFVQQAAGTFGSGWVWLIEDGGKLMLLSTSNAGNPLALGKRSLLGIDVWEHAYYLDYQNRRADHVAAVLDRLVNWDRVGERLTV